MGKIGVEGVSMASRKEEGKKEKRKGSTQGGGNVEKREIKMEEKEKKEKNQLTPNEERRRNSSDEESGVITCNCEGIYDVFEDVGNSHVDEFGANEKRDGDNDTLLQSGRVCEREKGTDKKERGE